MEKIDSPIKYSILKYISYISLTGGKFRQSLFDAEKSIQRDINSFKLKLDNISSKNKTQSPKNIHELFARALRFRKKKGLIKEFISSFIIIPIILFSIIAPPIILKELNTNFRTKEIIPVILIALSGFGISLILIFFFESIYSYFKNIKAKISGLILGIIAFVFWASLHASIILLYNKCSSNFEYISVNTLLCMAILYDSSLITYLLIEIIPDVYFFSQKINITDELIMESAFNLASEKNWGNVIRKRNQRNAILNEIERLAKLIENDWSNHIQTGDERNEKWKNKTLRGVAHGIRKTKQEIIIPRSDSPERLNKYFNDLLENLLTHNINWFLTEEVPSERLRKHSIIDSIKRIIVATLPLIVALCIYKFLPEFIPDDYKGLPIIIGSGWLIICLLIWLDPQIGDKISIARGGRNFFTSNKNENEE